LFRNVWLMGCTLLSNLPMYFLAVVWPWRVIMRPTEYCTMILLPKQSQNVPHVSLLKPGIPDCRLPSSSVNISHVRFNLSDVQVSWSWHHRLHIWPLLAKLTSDSFCENGLCCSGSIMIFTRCSSSHLLSSYDLCILT
jgi:hypothetical protein